jgi:hypothetical protein
MTAAAPATSVRDRFLVRYAVSSAAVASVTALVIRDPHGGGSYGVCPSLLLLGVYCPGCGALRGTHDLVTGDVVEAVGHNALLLPALAWLTWWWLAQATAGTRWQVRRPWDSARFAYLLLAVVLVFALARNLPGSPLAP